MTILNCLIEWFKFSRTPCSWVICWVFVQGVLSNNTIVAVKRLFMKTQQASSDFTNEVVLITNLRHQNLVNLKGFCLKGKEMLLVYEYVDNYDLDKILFGKFTHTFWLGKTWEQSWRMKITYQDSFAKDHSIYFLWCKTILIAHVMMICMIPTSPTKNVVTYRFKNTRRRPSVGLANAV